MRKFFLCAFFFLVGLGLGYYIGNETASTDKETTSTETSENIEENIDNSIVEPDIAVVSAGTDKETTSTETSKNTTKSIQQTDITMVSYKHNGDDTRATISLKNNTTKDIEQVQFRIIYYDMNNNQIDYRDFSVYTDIAPDLTKQIEISILGDFFEYHYYKSKKYSLLDESSTPYKIQYQLLGYKN